MTMILFSMLFAQYISTWVKDFAITFSTRIGILTVLKKSSNALQSLSGNNMQVPITFYSKKLYKHLEHQSYMYLSILNYNIYVETHLLWQFLITFLDIKAKGNAKHFKKANNLFDCFKDMISKLSFLECVHKTRCCSYISQTLLVVF